MSRTAIITDQIKNPTPLYAVIGAGDYVVESVLTAEAPKVDFDALVKQVQGIKLSDLQKQIKEIKLSELQDQAKGLPEHAQTVALEVIGQATNTYADLAKRGEVVVGRLRRTSFDDAKENFDVAKDEVVSVVEQIKDFVDDSAADVKADVKKASTEATTAAKKAGSDVKADAKQANTEVRRTTKKTATAVKKDVATGAKKGATDVKADAKKATTEVKGNAAGAAKKTTPTPNS